MADNNFRAHRGREVVRRDDADVATRDAAYDPLEELARLIGQADPVPDYGTRHDPRDTFAELAPASPAAPDMQWAADEAYAEPDAYEPQRYADPRDEDRYAAPREDDRYVEPDQDARYAQVRLADPPPPSRAYAPDDRGEETAPSITDRYPVQAERFDDPRADTRGNGPRYREESAPVPVRSSGRQLPPLPPQSSDDDYDSDEQWHDRDQDQSGSEEFMTKRPAHPTADRRHRYGRRWSGAVRRCGERLRLSGCLRRRDPADLATDHQSWGRPDQDQSSPWRRAGRPVEPARRGGQRRYRRKADDAPGAAGRRPAAERCAACRANDSRHPRDRERCTGRRVAVGARSHFATAHRCLTISSAARGVFLSAPCSAPLGRAAGACGGAAGAGFHSAFDRTEEGPHGPRRARSDWRRARCRRRPDSYHPAADRAIRLSLKPQPDPVRRRTPGPSIKARRWRSCRPHREKRGCPSPRRRVSRWHAPSRVPLRSRQHQARCLPQRRPVRAAMRCR